MTEKTESTHEAMAASYVETVSALAGDAEQLEQAYQAAQAAGEADAFRRAIDASFVAAPDNLLFAAWFHRLKHTAAQAKTFAIAWAWVIPLAAINGLLFWWLSDERRYAIEIIGAPQRPAYDFFPAVFLLAAPLSGALILIYLAAVSRKQRFLGGVIGISMLATGAYVLWAYPQAGTRPFQEQYLTLMTLHLPLLAWAGLGGFLIARHRDPASRFAFLMKSLEVFIMGGLFVIGGGVFIGITFGLFAALDIFFSDLVQRLFIAGGGGLIPVIATAAIYNPKVSPTEQAFDEGLSKLIALLMRVLLPLTLLVLLVYLAFIPFNFREPFENRDVLIIYDGMLFAVIALLLGATPVSTRSISERVARWLRLGIIFVAALALIISLYALAAILYRTVLDRLTPNRLAFIGWNLINIGLLALLLWRQARLVAGDWLRGLYRAYSAGTVAYAAWTLIVIFAVPWLFGIDQGVIETLPQAIQDIVYEEPNPILLKCGGSPHIYLLEGGEKRWVDSIATFEGRGYVWRDVVIVTCNDLRAVPDGVPIPADAGTPPQP